MNLYVHFPFCRAKCAYCALLSRAGSTPETRAAYVARIVREIAQSMSRRGVHALSTVYFGGGTPALCGLAPVFSALRPYLTDQTEFTVELHPHDVQESTLDELVAGGVNRVSLGVQSFDDDVLAAMGRGHVAAEAEDAFRRLQRRFPNSGLDLIAGWPGVGLHSWRSTLARALALQPAHVSCYTLIREPFTRLDLEVRRGRMVLPDDAAALEQFDVARDALAAAGLLRYEVSNFARPGFCCRHNASVWRGDDYIGVGEGAHGRVGLLRTIGRREGGWNEESLSPEADAFERAVLGLRTSAGIDLARIGERFPILAGRLPGWRKTLTALCDEAILANPARDSFAPTSRGFEVCDAVMEALM